MGLRTGKGDKDTTLIYPGKYANVACLINGVSKNKKPNVCSKKISIK